MVNELEGKLSVQMLSLSICPDQNAFSDLFSSAPDSKYNKGDITFLELVGKTLRMKADAEQVLKFEYCR